MEIIFATVVWVTISAGIFAVASQSNETIVRERIEIPKPSERGK